MSMNNGRRFQPMGNAGLVDGQAADDQQIMAKWSKTANRWLVDH